MNHAITTGWDSNGNVTTAYVIWVFPGRTNAPFEYIIAPSVWKQRWFWYIMKCSGERIIKDYERKRKWQNTSRNSPPYQMYRWCETTSPILRQEDFLCYSEVSDTRSNYLVAYEVGFPFSEKIIYWIKYWEV